MLCLFVFVGCGGDFGGCVGVCGGGGFSCLSFVGGDGACGGDGAYGEQGMALRHTEHRSTP